MHPIEKLISKERRCVVGLMSGTSVDGVDAVALDLWEEGKRLMYEIHGFETLEMPNNVRQEVLELCDEGGNVDLLCRVNTSLGLLFAEAALMVIDKAGIASGEVDLIGSHGQTVRHFPNADPPSTLQIGEAAYIARNTGIVTISDFRPADIAVGGQGAPLVPLVDHLLFSHEIKGRALLNIGGISNLTILPSGCGLKDIRAFDTGPGNMLIDAAVSELTHGVERYDKNGKHANSGKINYSLLNELMSHSYLQLEPPKSTGREEFGEQFFQSIIKRFQCYHDDLVTTLTEFSAQTVATAFKDFVTVHIDEVWVAGGGVHNEYLMSRLRDLVSVHQISSIAELGVNPDAREALSFAVLANETLMAKAGNVPAATGAFCPVVLGKISLP